MDDIRIRITQLYKKKNSNLCENLYIQETQNDVKKN